MVVAESSTGRTTGRNRGFYVRMRLSHNGGSRHGGRPLRDKLLLTTSTTFCWLFIWFSLSFFLFVSFFSTHKPPSSSSSSSSSSAAFLPKTTFLHHQSKASRALIESLATVHHQGALNGLKIFIYELPSEYNADWLSNERCNSHLFASEVAIHKALLSSDVRTLDPYEADFFFVPVYVSCNFSSVNGFPAIGHARQLLGSAVSLVASEFPFWNRSGGADHVFVASHDYGSCFHAMEDRAKADGIPEFLKNSIILQTFGVKYDHPCQDVENVVIPAYVPPEKVQSTLAMSPVNSRRDIFAFFRGKMEVHPKNISGRFYSKRVRTVIWQKYSNDRRFYLKRHRFAGYQSEIVRSKFCLCPLGWAPWSPRLVESVVLGCVPVIIADGIRLPFPSAVPWPEISLTVAERDVAKLGPILDHVAATNLTKIQRKLWDPDVRKALLYNHPMEEGDATWRVLESLSEKISLRSYRKSRHSSE